MRLIELQSYPRGEKSIVNTMYINPDEISHIYPVKVNSLNHTNLKIGTKIVLKDGTYFTDRRLIVDFIDHLKKFGIKVSYYV